MRYPEYLLKLIEALKRLPGVGSKTAERFAFHMMSWPEEKIEEFSTTLLEFKEKICYCETCGALLEKEICHLCNPLYRHSNAICIVSSIKDIFSIEGTKSYTGLYHVLGGLFSPLDGKFPDRTKLEKLKERITELQIKEAIIALDATLEGDATALFLKKELAALPISLSRLALGLPMGSSLEFIDEGTLSRAFHGRSNY